MTHKQHIPICPKCGYDQRGEIATWESVCPLEGQCSECGLEFAWADLLDLSRVDLGWYVEHAKTPWEMAQRTVPTLWMLLIPNRYWKRVGTHARVRLDRLLVWLMLMIVFLHLLSSASFTAALYSFDSRMKQSMIQNMSSVMTPTQLLTNGHIADFSSASYWREAIWAGLKHPYLNGGMYETQFAEGGVVFWVMCAGSSIIWMIIMGAVPTTRRLAKLRSRHVFRAGIIAGLLPIVLFEFGRLVDAAVFYEMAVGTYGSNLIEVTAGVVYISMSLFIVMIWMPWFWITAIRIGWEVRPSWTLIGLASVAWLIGGPLIGAGILGGLDAVGDLVEYLLY